MATVNVMYQTSLAQFVELFLKSMELADKSTLATKRVKQIVDTMTYLVYRYINKGLYDRDKMLFVFIVTVKIMITGNLLEVRRCGVGCCVACFDEFLPRLPPPPAALVITRLPTFPCSCGLARRWSCRRCGGNPHGSPPKPGSTPWRWEKTRSFLRSPTTFCATRRCGGGGTTTTSRSCCQ